MALTIIIYISISHITGFKSLEAVCYNVRLDHLTRGHIGSPAEADTWIDCTACTNITIFFNGDGASLITALTALSFLHIGMCHGAQDGDVWTNPGMRSDVDGAVVNERAILRNHDVFSDMDVISIMAIEWCFDHCALADGPRGTSHIST